MTAQYKTKSPHTNTFIFTIVALLFVGFLLVYDSTMFYSQNVYGNPYKFALLQLLWGVVGMVGFFIFFKIHYKNWLKLSVIFFIATLIFLSI
jgi:cell division protein FtsW (lipid II flippase)